MADTQRDGRDGGTNGGSGLAGQGLSENGSVKPSFVMRPLAMVVNQLAAGRVEEADSPPRLTVEATWGA